MFDDTMWAFGRASGIVDLVLLTVAVLGGILTRSGRPLPGIPRFALSLAHRNVSMLAVVFLVLHVATLLLDPYAKLTIADVVVPFAGAEKPFWLGLGTVAFDLLVAVVATALLQRAIGTKAFRAVHWLTYAMWPVAVLHSVFDGTDGTDAWFVVGTVLATAAVLAAVAWRLSHGFLETQSLRGPDRLRAPQRPDAELRRVS
ncbi:ferric reductase-like transmembrane domain-containing protein [Gryllotalpicola ginsengisoli]|uniref:ferric reductase-like transmembrane domain-containing protein n=1 Tax=Gryllotalpicola ginsengisoli TaxID=444608 RepID=UPI0003B67AB2|nr:ferric reductase-like transmembrane domain-containing protein [Gryllotalpicola ginsengisoli]